VYSIEEFARHRPTWLLPLPATGLLRATADNSLHALRHRNKIELWTVDLDTDTNESSASSSFSAKHKAQAETESDAEDDEDDDEESGRRALAQAQAASTGEDSACRLALRLQTKGEDNLHCIALAANGSALACSSARTGTRVWSLARETPDSVPSRDQDDYDNNNTKRMAKKGGKGKKQEAILIAPKLANELKVQRLKLPALAEGFCQSLVFSDDGKRLAAYTAKGLLLLMAVGEGATDGDDDADASEGPADKEDEEEEEEGAAATNGELNEDDDEDDNENDDEEKVEAEGDGDDDIEESDGDVDDEDEEEDDDDSDNDNDSDGVPSKKQRRSRPNTTTSSTSSTSTSRTTSSGVQLRHVFDHRSQVESLSLKSNKASAKSKNNSGSSSSSNNSSAWSGLESAVTKLCFSPDGMYLAVADADRTVYTYDIDR
jgi:WD40 repeat protein